ncbi:hypothetical protein [Pseudoalteromonas sp.]|uniref:hypothetical protein n=1 Tax=Pseudoalteromonas sp. TaxID=53249 RepID=UPI003001CA04
MLIKKINTFIVLSLLLFSDYSFSKSFPLNNIGCVLINEGYLNNDSNILRSNLVELSTNINKYALLYKNNQIVVKAKAATVIQTDRQKPWISSFELIISQMNKDTVRVRSSPRINDNEKMNIYFSISSGESSELVVSCSARE